MFLSVPLGTILPYVIDTPNEDPPAGYEYCDGSTLTDAEQDFIDGPWTLPDLRNRFLRGRNIVRSTNLTTFFNPDDENFTGGHPTSLSPFILPDDQPYGGSHTVTLTVENIASHGHAASMSAAAGSHNHTWTIEAAPNHTHKASAAGYKISGRATILNAWFPQYPDRDHGVYYRVNSFRIDAPDDGAHTHTVTVYPSGSHSHSTSISDVGSSTAWDSRPRYYGLTYIMKVRA